MSSMKIPAIKLDNQIGILLLATAFFVASMLLGSFVISTYVASVSTFLVSIFVSIFAYVMTFILFSLFSKNFRTMLEKYSTLVTILGVILPVLLLSLQVASETLLTSINAEASIKDGNHLNAQILKIVLSEDGALVPVVEDHSFLELNSDLYRSNYEYISHNYSLECRSAYINMMLLADQYNEINRLRHELSISKLELSNASALDSALEMEKYFSDTSLKIASSTRENLMFAIGNCQDLKQRKSFSKW